MYSKEFDSVNQLTEWAENRYLPRHWLGKSTIALGMALRAHGVSPEKIYVRKLGRGWELVAEFSTREAPDWIAQIGTYDGIQYVASGYNLVLLPV
ncbi:hypothetical protein EHYA_07613 [Embleya hyalina]|uniref:Uncharacterized protein n=1 Tax=Embleya hyalina TaxID=516124 RepID=A0A401YZ73_9ACTN|nr:hypothetical protein EHYA_07613 [Embleya hyalina]